MLDEQDIAYTQKREAEERAAARRACDPAVKDAHAEMADRYADRLWSARERRCEEGNAC